MRRIDIFAVQIHPAFKPSSRNQIVHAIQGSQERGLAAARRPDEGRHEMLANLHVDIVKRLLSSVDRNLRSETSIFTGVAHASSGFGSQLP